MTTVAGGGGSGVRGRGIGGVAEVRREGERESKAEVEQGPNFFPPSRVTDAKRPRITVLLSFFFF